MSKPSSSLKVYIFASPLPLDTIKNELMSTGEKMYHVGVVNNWKVDEKRLVETKNNLVICEEPLKDALMKKFPKYNGKVWDFNWDKFLKEPSENESYTIHISGFPIRWEDHDVKNYIYDRLDCLIDPDDYTVNLSMVRETGKIKGYGTIVFSDKVTNEYRKYAKLILHNKVIREEDTDEKDLSVLKAVWSRKTKTNRTTTVKSPLSSTAETNPKPTYNTPSSNPNPNVNVNTSNINKTKVNKKVIAIKQTVNPNQTKSNLPQVS